MSDRILVFVINGHDVSVMVDATSSVGAARDLALLNSRNTEQPSDFWAIFDEDDTFFYPDTKVRDLRTSRLFLSLKLDRIERAGTHKLTHDDQGVFGGGDETAGIAAIMNAASGSFQLPVNPLTEAASEDQDIIVGVDGTFPEFATTNDLIGAVMRTTQATSRALLAYLWKEVTTRTRAMRHYGENVPDALSAAQTHLQALLDPVYKRPDDVPLLVPRELYKRLEGLVRVVQARGWAAVMNPHYQGGAPTPQRILEALLPHALRAAETLYDACHRHYDASACASVDQLVKHWAYPKEHAVHCWDKPCERCCERDGLPLVGREEDVDFCDESEGSDEDDDEDTTSEGTSK